MLYGYRKDNTETVVTASHGNTPILIAWYESIAQDDDTFTARRETEFMDKFTEEFGRVRHEVYIFSHNDEAQQEAFITKHGIIIQNTMSAWDRHDEMVDFDAPDFYDPAETRTIEEIEDLVENDRWDRRTDEQREADKKMREHVDALKKAGAISSDGSFDARKDPNDDGGAHVTDIRTSRDADGKIQIDDVLARKDYSDLRQAAKEQENKENGGEGTDPA